MDLNTGLVFALSRVQGFLIWLVPSRDPGLGHVFLRKQSLRGKAYDLALSAPGSPLPMVFFLVKVAIR